MAELTLDYLREMYDYDAASGTMVYKPAQRVAGTVDDRGRTRFNFGKRKYFMRRIVWWYVTGKEPDGDVRVADPAKPECAIDNLLLHRQDGCVIRARDAINKGSYAVCTQ